MRDFLSRKWEYLIGDRVDFSDANRSFNAISLITVVFLAGLLPFNIMIGLREVCLLLAILIPIKCIFYFRGRLYKKHFKIMWLYSLVSYAVLSITYYFNSGIDGPTIFLFFLSFNLLIAFSHKKHHIVWVILHSVFALTLLAIECFNPDLIKNVYKSRNDRFFDIASSYFVTLAVIYFITTYLRSNLVKEKKLLEERSGQLAVVNEQKNKLFSILAHDLRSPINNLQGYLEMLSDSELSAAEHEMMQDELLQQTKKTADLLTNLLSWTKSQMEGISVQTKPLLLLQSLEHTIELQKKIASHKGIVIETKSELDVQVMADYDMLNLVARNLINNAIKFTQPGGEISVRISSLENDCLVRIRDTA